MAAHQCTVVPIEASEIISVQGKGKKIVCRGVALVGKKVRTSYGNGICSAYRENDRMYEIQLGTPTKTRDKSSIPMLYTRVVPEQIRTQEDETDSLNVAYEALEKMRRLNLEMQCFNVGITKVDFDYCTTCLLSNSIPTKRFPRLQKVYEGAGSAQENVSSSFAKFPLSWGTPQEANPTETKPAAIATGFQSLRNFAAATNQSVMEAAEKKGFPKIPSLWEPKTEPTKTKEQEISNEKSDHNANKPVAQEEKRVLPRIQNLLDSRLKQQSPPCLICASPSCPEHSSPGFRKDGITLCLSCERLFELDFIVDCVKEEDPQVRAKHIDHMVDCYDRCLLLLKYSSRYIEAVAKSLESGQETQNKIGLGSSGVGMLSGVLGIAAAATILTPAGPPLLIASLVFGGSATTVQVGSEAMNFLSEPNKLADRIIALHGMTLSILRVTSTLRDAMMRDFIRTDGVFEQADKNLADEIQKKFEKNRTGVIVGANAGRSVALGGMAISEAGAVAGAEAGVLAARAASTEAGALAATGASAGARGASTMSRASTAAARGLRFARFAGGALSAAVLLIEANAIHQTLRSIREGNPCEKAKTMRQILQEINEESLPSTSDLDEECQAYLEAMQNRPPPLPEVKAEQAEGETGHFPEAACVVASNDELSAPGAVIVEGENVGSLTHPAVSDEQSQRSVAASSSSVSLLERIQMHQDRQRAREDEVFAVAVESEQARRAQLNLIS